MRVLVVGQGPSGSYLSCCLRSLGDLDVTLVDDGAKSGHLCAWGTTEPNIAPLLRRVGFNIKDYVLAEPKRAYVNGLKLDIRGLAIIDKPRLLRDLSRGVRSLRACVHSPPAGYDLVVDATGVGNLIGPQQGVVVHFVQCNVESSSLDHDSVLLHIVSGGYAWAFPLGEGKWHVGAMHVRRRVLSKLLTEVLRALRSELIKFNCNCPSSYAILSTPSKACLIKGNTVAVGGSALCVNPITGEGIAPSMVSAKILSEAIVHNSVKDYPSELVRALAKKMHFDEAYQILKKYVEGGVSALDVVKLLRLLNLQNYISKGSIMALLSRVKNFVGMAKDLRVQQR